MHPTQVLFPGTRQPVSIPVCDHYAGSEKLMRKSIALQQELGPIFDITLDCEDGASAGNEAAHAQLVGSLIAGDDNRFGRIGARVHDVTSPFFEQDVATICATAAVANISRLAYLMLPKADGLADVQRAIATISRHTSEAGRRMPPLHVLIETHGALEDVHQIAALPQVESLSFGVMDFVSAHYGAIPSTAMRSPGQFTHPLVARAKLEISAACHAHGKVPSHNVTTDIKDAAWLRAMPAAQHKNSATPGCGVSIRIRSKRSCKRSRQPTMKSVKRHKSCLKPGMCNGGRYNTTARCMIVRAIAITGAFSSAATPAALLYPRQLHSGLQKPAQQQQPHRFQPPCNIEH